MLRFYKHLIRFRDDHSLGQRDDWEIRECGDRMLLVLLGSGPRLLSFIFHFGDAPSTIEVALPGEHDGYHRAARS